MHFLPVRLVGPMVRSLLGAQISVKEISYRIVLGGSCECLSEIPEENLAPLPRLLKGNPRTVIVHILYLEPQPMVQEARELTAGFYLQDYRQ